MSDFEAETRLCHIATHVNKIYHVCEAISGYFVLLARNRLASRLDYIVMQIRTTNREKGYTWLSVG